jgi:hypothetical protein
LKIISGFVWKKHKKQNKKINIARKSVRRVCQIRP